MNVPAADLKWLKPLAEFFFGLAFFASACPAHGDEMEAAPTTLTGGWSARTKLASHGVAPFATLTGEFWGNAAGGLQTGAQGDTQLDFGVQLDTAKLGGWPGGSFLAEFHWLQIFGHGCFAEKTGAANPVSGLIAADHFRLFNLYYRQSWKNDAVIFKTGQIAVDDDFMRSDYAGLFLNSAFGAMPSQTGTRLAACCGYEPPFPMYPVAGPGAFVSVKPSGEIDLQAGVYDGQPGTDTESNHGFDWSLRDETGIGVFYEGDLAYAIEKHAGTFRLGGTYHSGLFDDYARINAGFSDAAKNGIHSFYAVNDFALLAPDTGKTVLGLFTRAGISPQTDRSIVTVYADAGLNWFAPLPGRDNDVAGIAFSWTKFSGDFRRAPGSGGVPASQSALELTYSAQATRWLTLQADAQFLFNPVAVSNSSSGETAVVLGLRAVFKF